MKSITCILCFFTLQCLFAQTPLWSQLQHKHLFKIEQRNARLLVKTFLSEEVSPSHLCSENRKPEIKINSMRLAYGEITELDIFKLYCASNPSVANTYHGLASYRMAAIADLKASGSYEAICPDGSAFRNSYQKVIPQRVLLKVNYDSATGNRRIVAPQPSELGQPPVPFVKHLEANRPFSTFLRVEECIKEAFQIKNTRAKLFFASL